jgi:hypothetical protein
MHIGNLIQLPGGEPAARAEALLGAGQLAQNPGRLCGGLRTP